MNRSREIQIENTPFSVAHQFAVYLEQKGIMERLTKLDQRIVWRTETVEVFMRYIQDNRGTICSAFFDFIKENGYKHVFCDDWNCSNCESLIRSAVVERDLTTTGPTFRVKHLSPAT